MQIFNKASTKDKRKELRKSQTEGETALWQKLRGKQFLGYKFFRQYGVGEYIVDFYCPRHKLAIEVDGGQHYTKKGFEYDRVRAEYMDSLGIRTLRFSNLDVLQNMEGVLLQIQGKLNSP